MLQVRRAHKDPPEQPVPPRRFPALQVLKGHKASWDRLVLRVAREFRVQ